MELDARTAVRGGYAGWWQRVFAIVLDSIILSVVFYPLLFAAGGDGGTLAVLYLVSAIVAAAYSTILIGGDRGQTIGKRALGIRVRDRATGGPIGYGRAFGRWAAYAVLSLIPLVNIVNVLWPIWDANKQTFHDKLVGTVVVDA